MVCLVVLNHPQNPVVELARSKNLRLGPFRIRTGKSKEKTRLTKSTGHNEKCGDLAATPTTSAASQPHRVGGTARRKVTPGCRIAAKSQCYFRQDNLRDDY